MRTIIETRKWRLLQRRLIRRSLGIYWIMLSKNIHVNRYRKVDFILHSWICRKEGQHYCRRWYTYRKGESRISEFLNFVSRGKLHHPREDLFDLSMYLFCYYKCADKTCIKKLLKGFMEIYNLTGFNFEGKQTKILQRFANCFSNGFRKQQAEKIKLDKSQKNLVKRKRMER